MKSSPYYACSIAVFSLLFQSGCNLYLYDKGKSDAAKSAKEAFASFSKSSPDRYDAMTKNLQRIAAEEDALVAELASNTDTARVTLNPTATFRMLIDDATATVGELDRFEGSLKEAIVKKLSTEEERADARKNAGAAVAAAEKAVASAKVEVTRWNATEAVFLKAIESLPEFRKKVAESGKDLGDAFGESAAALGDKEVKFFDADGTEVTKKVKDLGSDAVKAIAKGELKGFPRAPGADLVILNLALELAKVEQKRARRVQQRAEAVAEMSREAFVEAEVARQLLKDGLKNLDVVGTEYSEQDANGDPTMTVTPLQAIAIEQVVIAADQAKAKSDGEAAVTAAGNNVQEATKARLKGGRLRGIAAQKALNRAGLIIEALRRTAVGRAMALRTVNTFKLREARVAHENSIVDSALNDEQWRVLLSSGLDGLDRYYAEGVRPEDIANYIRLGQAIATGVIAGKVD